MNLQSFWYPEKKIPQTLWSDFERDWLLYPGSLTQRLRHFTLGRIQLRVIRDVFEIPHKEEQTVFGEKGVMRIREVDWWYQDNLWIAARVVIPLITLEVKGGQLKHIGEQSLGDILFTDPQLARSDFEFSQIAKNHHYYYRISSSANIESVTWARRSLFYFNGSPLLVSEIFLPTLFSCSCYR